jgi:hypothetical protein
VASVANDEPDVVGADKGESGLDVPSAGYLDCVVDQRAEICAGVILVWYKRGAGRVCPPGAHWRGAAGVVRCWVGPG